MACGVLLRFVVFFCVVGVVCFASLYCSCVLLWLVVFCCILFCGVVFCCVFLWCVVVCCALLCVVVCWFVLWCFVVFCFVLTNLLSLPAVTPHRTYASTSHVHLMLRSRIAGLLANKIIEFTMTIRAS